MKQTRGAVGGCGGAGGGAAGRQLWGGGRSRCGRLVLDDRAHSRRTCLGKRRGLQRRGGLSCVSSVKQTRGAVGGCGGAGGGAGRRLWWRKWWGGAASRQLWGGGQGRCGRLGLDDRAHSRRTCVGKRRGLQRRGGLSCVSSVWQTCGSVGGCGGAGGGAGRRVGSCGAVGGAGVGASVLMIARTAVERASGRGAACSRAAGCRA